MSRLFALLVLVAVIAVANAQYYGGYYGGLGTYGAGMDIPILGTAMADILVLVLDMGHSTRSRYL
ncbi:hypothetical protein Ocin01_20065 [Orchesella cincta]|uniref:Uncharacterized protein n=1 Tax=Orchesella cincta TaxID=48709 RepID=A0A1D2M0X9_ORCCI|nr:hypothetical protein Ocin01_20065 [Orchesella cincta]